jgi:hypothetical protein
MVAVTLVLPPTPLKVALMLALPGVPAVTSPRVPALLETAAIALLVDVQVDDSVTSCVELSVNVAVALSCTLSPFGTIGPLGVTVIVATVAGVTVSVVLACTAPSCAEITVAPTSTLVARPREPAVFEMVATPVALEPQVTVVVRSCVELSE